MFFKRIIDLAPIDNQTVFVYEIRSVSKRFESVKKQLKLTQTEPIENYM